MGQRKLNKRKEEIINILTNISADFPKRKDFHETLYEHNAASDHPKFLPIMRSLHNVHEMNTYRAGHVCLSIRVIQLENRWTDLDEILYVWTLCHWGLPYFSIFYHR
jgi:hypothetical protein